MRACKHCDRTTRSSDDVARLQGWRWYSGPTQGGGHLDDVVCPVCAGFVVAEKADWLVGCNTCDWVFEPFDDSDGERLLTGRNALDAASHHECEPDVWIQRPGDEATYRESDFDREGNLRRRLVSA